VCLWTQLQDHLQPSKYIKTTPPRRLNPRSLYRLRRQLPSTESEPLVASDSIVSSDSLGTLHSIKSPTALVDSPSLATSVPLVLDPGAGYSNNFASVLPFASLASLGSASSIDSSPSLVLSACINSALPSASSSSFGSSSMSPLFPIVSCAPSASFPSASLYIMFPHDIFLFLGLLCSSQLVYFSRFVFSSRFTVFFHRVLIPRIDAFSLVSFYSIFNPSRLGPPFCIIVFACVFPVSPFVIISRLVYWHRFGVPLLSGASLVVNKCVCFCRLGLLPLGFLPLGSFQHRRFSESLRSLHRASRMASRSTGLCMAPQRFPSYSPRVTKDSDTNVSPVSLEGHQDGPTPSTSNEQLTLRILATELPSSSPISEQSLGGSVLQTSDKSNPSMPALVQEDSPSLSLRVLRNSERITSSIESGDFRNDITADTLNDRFPAAISPTSDKSRFHHCDMRTDDSNPSPAAPEGTQA
jgi:hypothetical protein